MIDSFELLNTEKSGYLSKILTESIPCFVLYNFVKVLLLPGQEFDTNQFMIVFRLSVTQGEYFVASKSRKIFVLLTTVSGFR